MAWSAPTEWERWDPGQILQCPYDETHRIPAKRYQYHILKCREQHPEKDFVRCPFNAKHVMLRTELRQHIARCTDKGEIEPYSHKGYEQDSEGFYFKGDTSVPCYRREEMSIPPEDDWDREDDETTTQQNLCEYYKQKQEIKTTANSYNQGFQDVLSLPHDERERFKDAMRSSAVRLANGCHGDGYYNNQQNHQSTKQISQQPAHNIYTPQVRPIYQPSSNNNTTYHGNQSSHLASIKTPTHPAHSNLPQVRPIYQPSSSYHRNHSSSQSSSAYDNSYRDNQSSQPSSVQTSTHLSSYNNGYYDDQPSQPSSVQTSTHQSSYNNGYYDDQPSQPSSVQPSTHLSSYNNGYYDNQPSQPSSFNQPSHPNSTLQSTTQLTHNVDTLSASVSNEPLGLNNSHTFRGAGRARLAEEAKRSQFGIKMGRGRGMLEFN